MWDRVQDAYPRVMPVVATAIVQAGGNRDAIVRMVGNKANRAAVNGGVKVGHWAAQK